AAFSAGGWLRQLLRHAQPYRQTPRRTAEREPEEMRVLLSGYYGFGNLGDEAILAGLGSALEHRGHQPVVLSNDPAGTERLHSFEARHRVRGLVGALTSVDAVVSGGGGLLQDATSARSLTYYLSVLRLARAFGRRTAVYAQSLGPLSDS